MSLVTSSVKWLTIALLTASLAACGASDSGSSPVTATVAKTTESNTAKDTQSVKAGIHFPKFSEIRFSTPVSTGGSTATSVLKAVNKSAGLVGGYLYPQYVWNSHRINVCWVNPTGWDEQEREWTREAVTGTWDANSDVTFVDWTECPEWDPSNPYLGVRIVIYSDRPKSHDGETIIAYQYGVYLNLDFATWGYAETNDCRTSLGKPICIKNEAIHEFGHVLGFIHEQDRPDTPEACVEQVKNGESTYQFKTDGLVNGPWDVDSIMNYCTPAGFYKTPRGLTAGDITMLQKYYGKPGSKIYSVFTANDPPIVSIQDSKTFADVADYITIPNAQGSVLRHFYATPDGNKVAYTLFNQQKGSSVLGYIDTQTDTLRGQKAIAEEVVDMKVSSDSKYAYVVWKNGATGGLRAYDLNAFTVAWDLPLTGASQIVAQRVASSQRIYVVKSSGTGSAQSIVAVDASSHTQVASYAVGTTRARPLVVGLTPDEATLYLADPGPDNQSAPFIASLDTTSGQYTVLQPISPADASVHDLHVLDSNQVVLGTNKQGISPLLYTVSANSFSALTGGVPGDWSLPYVYSPDGKTIFSMGQYWDGKIPYYTFIRLDSYRLGYATTPVVWDGSNHPVISAGFGQDVVTRPFAVIYR